MKIFIVGLGLMGASYAEGLSKQGHSVHGYDQQEGINEQAIKDGVIKSASLEELKTSDLVILCLYPHDNIEFVKTHKDLFTTQIVTDIAGTKHDMMKSLVELLPRGVSYISHHPMAGREKTGYDARDITMFKGANFLVIPSINHNPSDLHIIRDLANDLGFGKITYLSAKEHDELIAFTSQLTHILAVSLMLANPSPHTKDATGDSFRDLTRIAKINEDMWTELFLNNKQALIEQIDAFIKTLETFKTHIQNGNSEQLKEDLRKAKALRVTFDEHKR